MLYFKIFLLLVVTNFCTNALASPTYKCILALSGSIKPIPEAAILTDLSIRQLMANGQVTKVPTEKYAEAYRVILEPILSEAEVAETIIIIEESFEELAADGSIALNIGKHDRTEHKHLKTYLPHFLYDKIEKGFYRHFIIAKHLLGARYTNTHPKMELVLQGEKYQIQKSMHRDSHINALSLDLTNQHTIIKGFENISRINGESTAINSEVLHSSPPISGKKRLTLLSSWSN